jgi:hypothetical protein
MGNLQEFGKKLAALAWAWIIAHWLPLVLGVIAGYLVARVL